MKVDLRFGPAFEEGVRQLEREIRSAGAEGQDSIDLLCDDLAHRLRALFQASLIGSSARMRRNVEAGSPPDLPVSLGAHTTEDAAFSDPAGLPASRSGRPLGAAESMAPRFTAYRRENGLSSTTIADRATKRGYPLSRGTVLSLERGETAVQMRHIQAIAAGLGQSPDFVHDLFFAPLGGRGRGHVIET